MVPGVSHLNGLIGWFQNIDQHEFPIEFTIGSLTIAFDLIDTMSFWGIGVLQAAVIISIFQLGSAWVRGFDAWPRGAPTYYAAFALETILFLLLAIALWLVLSGDNHGKLLGSGAAAWWPGILVTILTGVLAGGGSLLARAIRSPATTRAFGTVAAVVFIAAIACAGVAIFGPDGLPDAETAYVVIWVTFVILYRLGLSRWHHWDHLERHIACEPTADRPVNRWPAYLTSAALLLAVGAVSIAILDWENGRRFVIALLIVAAGVAGAGYIVGTAVARNRSDPIAAPDSVESQSWL
jgi:hypothetical protein